MRHHNWRNTLRYSALLLGRDPIKLNRDHGLAFCLSMIFFRKPVPTFRDHALGATSHCELRHAHIPKATRRASPLPSPRERLRVVGRGRGWGAFVRNCTTPTAPPPTRRAAFRRRATLPTASRGEGWCPQLRLCPLQRCVHAVAPMGRGSPAVPASESVT